MTSKEKTKSLVNKATTDDRNPPSGYLLKELSSRTMSIAECQTIEDLVVKKLSKNKPYIKYKSLRIVKFLCENGSPNWRRAWQRNTDKLRDAQQFRGPPDPIYGDAPYQQVRKAAKDAMQAVFQQSQIDSSHIKNRIKSIDGGSAYNSSSYSGSSTFASGSKGVYGGSSLHKKDKAPSAPGSQWDKKPMPGHGNTSYQPTVHTTTFAPLKSSGAYSNPSVLAGTNAHSRGKLDTRKVGKRKKGKAGGVWGNDGDDNNNDDDDDEEEEEDDYNNTYDDDFPSSDRYEKPRKKIGSFGGNIKRKSKASSGQYEKRWVDDIVKSGGVGCKILDLPKYVQQFENLSKNHVLEYLDEKLEDSTWQKQGKSLALIEALIKGKSSDDVIDYFTQSPDNIQSLQNAKKSILRRKANAIIEYLDVDDDDDDDEDDVDDDEQDDDEQNQQQQQQQQQQSQGVDLLNIGGNEEEEDDDMFGGMDKVSSQQQQQQDLMGGDMFANMNKTSNISTQQTKQTDDIMGIMSGHAIPTQKDIKQMEENKRSKEKYAFLDMVANDTHVTQTNTANDTDILGMGFGNKSSAQQQQTTNNASSGASAFGFDLSGSGGDTAQQQQQQQQQEQQQQEQQHQSSGGGSSAFGFDLSGGGGGNTSQQQQQQQPASTGNIARTGNTSGGSSAFGFDLSGQTAQSQNTLNTTSTNPIIGNMANMSPINNMMITQQMLAANQQNRQFVSSNISQMNQMQSMMNQMQQIGMNPNMMNQMQMNMNNMNNMVPPQQQQHVQQHNNLFTQTMANINQPQQQQRQQQTYNHNDPFAQMMTSSSQQTQNAPQRTKKSGPDPFAEFGLKSMQ